ncbi:MAG TPA: 4-oxalocrotonate tautomerase family protein [Terriglobales bacterium]|nr:4-oxalocrotonate tautomerase family protein [Terriglobales bacterium]
MPHVVIKLVEGRTEEQKREIIRRITDVLVEVAGTVPGNVSVAFEDIKSCDWNEQVSLPCIYGRRETVLKWPDYLPEDEQP